jgi:pyruvate/2-oxoglutarate dehydrogenase complex dihydrolipoamide acyltransferase (E2) component
VSSSPTDPANGSSAPARSLVEVTMPQMGVSVAEGTLVAWHKRVGDWVQAEETICEISTDKVDSDVPAPASGRVAEILVELEQTVPVGSVLARIATDALAGEPHPDERMDGRGDEPEPQAAGRRADGSDDEHPPQGAERRADEPRRAPAAQTGARRADQRSDAPRPQPQPGAGPAGGGHRSYSPVVQRIAASEGVDLSQVPGSGRRGRVTKQDVLAYIARRRSKRKLSGRAEEQSEPPLHTESPYREPLAQSASERAPSNTGESQRLSRMRRSIAEHMLRSLRTAAHCTSIVEADFSAVEAAREALRLTYLPFVARCAIDALRAHPELNATLEGESLTLHQAVNLGIAISLGRDGLIVPVIHDAHELSHEGLARRISELSRRARAGELSVDDVRGGTFTITNPGSFGTLLSTPIINQPQVAILDLEAVVKRPVVVSDERGRDSIAIRPMAYLCLSWDHRALDGALAAQFLQTLRERIEGWSV